MKMLGSESGAAAHANVEGDASGMKEAEEQQAKRRSSIDKIANAMGDDAARELATK